MVDNITYITPAVAIIATAITYGDSLFPSVAISCAVHVLGSDYITRKGDSVREFLTAEFRRSAF